MHQSCAAGPSAYSPVVRRWLFCYSSRLQVRSWTSSLVSGFCSSACCLSPCLDPPSLWGRWLLAFSVRRVSSPPGEGDVLVLSVLRFFVVLVGLAVEEFFLLSSVRLSLLFSWLWYDLDFDDFFLDSVFGPFCGIFRVAGYPPGGEICGV